ncbi:MAG: ferric reductase-like transmembrane domain-containing protein [Candidatus Moranbacteria bacterium]|nr:ferric reductase-like transmembrane domain-containing protein [Candidatus Moranbacteria bacterium]
MSAEIQIPWGWYTVRASALIGFLLLYISVFVGTVSCLPGIRKYFLRLGSLSLHCWISLQALIFALVHGFTLFFHKFIPFSLADILIPFHSSYEPFLVALGTVSLYIMIILVATSYARKYISQKLWRSIHFLNIALYIFSIIHAFYLGTDLKSGLLREVFIWANGILILLLAYNMFYRIWYKIKKREVVCEIPAPNSYEDIRQSYASRWQKRNRENFRRRI